MGCNTSRRGRPKGTGIDDSRRLREIAAMIANDPDLKPTTAIKNCGISDPSTIRRLRDKFNSEKDELLQDLKVTRPSPPASGITGKPRATEMRAVPLNHKREPTKTAEVGKKSGSEKSAESEDDPHDAGFLPLMPEEVVRRLFIDSFRSATALIHFNTLFAAHLFQTPAVRSALRYQLAFSQSLLGFDGSPCATARTK